MTTKEKIRYFFRPNWAVSRLRWITFKVPFFSVRVYFKSYMLPYIYIIIVFILAYVLI